ncbi:MAG: DUF4278 domain-containing protein [Pseudomonadota bacterium]
MSKQTYRGVTRDSSEKPENDHHHEKGLKYRGVDYDGDQAEKEAEAAPNDHQKVYRGVVQENDEPKS